MDTSLTILISVIALLISAFSLGWNVYRDVILKPRLKVITQISYIFHAEEKLGPYINIQATNHGPGSITCESVHMARKSKLRFLGQKILKHLNKDNKYAFVVHDYTNQYSAQLPKKLEVGEKMDLFFTEAKDSLLAVDPTHVGIYDSFGRQHWSTSESLKQAKIDFFKDFPKKEWGSDQNDNGSSK
jgi:hypothetical protein